MFILVWIPVKITTVMQGIGSPLRKLSCPSTKPHGNAARQKVSFSFPESKKKLLLWVYLDPKILLPEIAKGHADGMIYHIRDALQHNLGNGFHPLKGTPSTHSLVAIGLLHLSCSQRKNQQVMHSSHPGKLELVVQHVSDSGCGGIVHHNAAINRSTRSVAVYRLHVSGFEEGRNRRGSSTDFPEIEIPCLILQGIGSGE
jgi:hypothetical protein